MVKLVDTKSVFINDRNVTITVASSDYVVIRGFLYGSSEFTTYHILCAKGGTAAAKCLADNLRYYTVEFNGTTVKFAGPDKYNDTLSIEAYKYQ